jgi:hypothetical protein
MHAPKARAPAQAGHAPELAAQNVSELGSVENGTQQAATMSAKLMGKGLLPNRPTASNPLCDPHACTQACMTVATQSKNVAERDRTWQTVTNREIQYTHGDMEECVHFFAVVVQVYKRVQGPVVVC